LEKYSISDKNKLNINKKLNSEKKNIEEREYGIKENDENFNEKPAYKNFSCEKLFGNIPKIKSEEIIDCKINTQRKTYTNLVSNQGKNFSNNNTNGNANPNIKKQFFNYHSNNYNSKINTKNIFIKQSLNAFSKPKSKYLNPIKYNIVNYNINKKENLSNDQNIKKLNLNSNNEVQRNESSYVNSYSNTENNNSNTKKNKNHNIYNHENNMELKEREIEKENIKNLLLNKNILLVNNANLNKASSPSNFISAKYKNIFGSKEKNSNREIDHSQNNLRIIDTLNTNQKSNYSKSLEKNRSYHKFITSKFNMGNYNSKGQKDDTLKYNNLYNNTDKDQSNFISNKSKGGLNVLNKTSVDAIKNNIYRKLEKLQTLNYENKAMNTISNAKEYNSIIKVLTKQNSLKNNNNTVSMYNRNFSAKNKNVLNTDIYTNIINLNNNNGICRDFNNYISNFTIFNNKRFNSKNKAYSNVKPRYMLEGSKRHKTVDAKENFKKLTNKKTENNIDLDSKSNKTNGIKKKDSINDKIRNKFVNSMNNSINFSKIHNNNNKSKDCILNKNLNMPDYYNFDMYNFTKPENLPFNNNSSKEELEIDDDTYETKKKIISNKFTNQNKLLENFDNILKGMEYNNSSLDDNIMKKKNDNKVELNNKNKDAQFISNLDNKDLTKTRNEKNIDFHNFIKNEFFDFTKKSDNYLNFTLKNNGLSEKTHSNNDIINDKNNKLNITDKNKSYLDNSINSKSINSNNIIKNKYRDLIDNFLGGN